MKIIKRKPKVLLRSFIHRNVKGFFYPIPYRIVCDSGDWTPFFGVGYTDKQKYGPYDTDDCWQYSSVKGIEMQFNNLWARGEFSPEAKQFFVANGIATPAGIFHISDRFYGILGGNRNTGGTAEELFQLVQKYGIIPYDTLAYTDAEANACPTYQIFLDDYFNPAKVTQAMLDLGKQSLGYFRLGYQRIGVQFSTPTRTLLAGAIKQAPLEYGIPVSIQNWNQVNIPPDNTLSLDHEVTGYNVSQNGTGYPIVDNYLPYLKLLEEGYGLYSVTQGVVTAQAMVLTVPWYSTVWNAVMAYFRNAGLVSA